MPEVQTADRYTNFNLFRTIDQTTQNRQESSVVLPNTALETEFFVLAAPVILF
ncbi:hypothetical protein [Microcoleus vaginatus]|uniref:hypothetical protein n=1 Tax=Microcoleus vaginatus TaxID=119532 RepID=UPI00031CA8E9